MSPPRLSEATLDALPSDVVRPGYDRGSVEPGVVHLGIGAFHRAHQAVVFEDLIAGGDRRWGVCAASLRSPTVRDQLAPQDGLYCVLVRDAEHSDVRVIGAVQRVLVAPEDPQALVEALAAPQTRLVTLTVTEKGYRLDAASGALVEDDADVAADLASLARPRTVPGFLTAALAVRRERGLAPFTAISCDNMRENGRRLEQAVLAMAGRHDPALADWIARNAAFPQTMVDRIVPATTDADIAELAERIGVRDEGMVKTEPFTQWVVEDRFAGERPPLEAAGVQVVSSVAPWEEAKLRLLNGAHSGMAYLGGLAGLEFLHQVIARPEMGGFVERLWQEQQSTLEPPPGLDLAAYRQALLGRFANPSLHHRTSQIAMDGSQKLPQRFVVPMAMRLERGQPIDAMALVLAAWMRWQEGVDEAGRSFVVDDPLASTTRRLVDGEPSVAGKVDALLSLRSMFPEALARDPRVRSAITEQAERLRRWGAAATAERLGQPNTET